AQRTLQQQGFGVTINRRFDNTVKDNVIEQTPKAGAKVPEGSRVTLTVSNGPAPVMVPNFVGLTLNKAEAVARTAGITLDASQRIPGVPANTIASQSIASDTKVDRNATVRVIVNGGLATAPTPPPGENAVTLP